MYFEKKNITVTYFSVLLKGADKTIAICAEKTIKKGNNYEFLIGDNLVVILPISMVENIVE